MYSKKQHDLMNDETRKDSDITLDLVNTMSKNQRSKMWDYFFNMTDKDEIEEIAQENEQDLYDALMGRIRNIAHLVIHDEKR